MKRYVFSFTTGWSTWWWSILCLSRWWQLVFHVKKVTYIPNFVNKEKWHPLPARRGSETSRTELGLSNNQFIVVGAGQVQKRKGIDDFIRLAEELPQITFIWAGGFSFGGMTDGYERYKKSWRIHLKFDFSRYCIRQSGCAIVCPSESFLVALVIMSSFR